MLSFLQEMHSIGIQLAEHLHRHPLKRLKLLVHPKDMRSFIGKFADLLRKLSGNALL